MFVTQNRYKRAVAEVSDRDESIRSLQGEIQALREELEGSRAQGRAIATELERVQAHSKVLGAELDEVRSQAQTLAAANERLRVELDRAHGEHEAAANGLNSRIWKLTSSLAGLHRLIRLKNLHEPAEIHRQRWLNNFNEALESAGAHQLTEENAEPPSLIVDSISPFQVFQRVGATFASPGDATITVSGRILGLPPSLLAGAKMFGTVELISKRAKVQERRVFPTWDGDRFEYSISVPAGGWYRLNTSIQAPTPVQPALTGPFGVGEVFIIAGQSYAVNSGRVLTTIDDPTGRAVVWSAQQNYWRIAHDPIPMVTDDQCSDERFHWKILGERIATEGILTCGGSVWPTTLNMLLQAINVPIAIVNTACGGTPIADWAPRTPLFINLAMVCRKIGSFRAVLWQHGETDAILGTRPSDYLEGFAELRQALAQEIGWRPDWLTALSTSHPVVGRQPMKEEAFRAALRQLWERAPDVHPGPDTDTLDFKTRETKTGGGHYAYSGQVMAGTLWAQSIVAHLRKLAQEETGLPASTDKPVHMDSVLRLRGGSPLPAPSMVAPDTMVSAEGRFAWLCVPKVASRSIIKALGAHPSLKAVRLSELTGFDVRAPAPTLQRQGNLFRVAFVRNPWMRLASFYVDKFVHFDGSKGKQDLFAKYQSLSPKMTFDELVEWIAGPNGADKFADHHWISQSLFVKSQFGTRAVDFIGRYENLETDFATVMDVLGFPDIELPVKNSNAARTGMSASEITRHYRSLYSPRTIEMVRKRYAEDVQTFGYEF